MKQVTLLALMAIALTGCNLTNSIGTAWNYVEKKCPKTEVKNPLTGTIEVHYRCDSLWPTQKISDKCRQADVCVEVSTGRITLDLVCDSVINTKALTRALKPKP